MKTRVCFAACLAGIVAVLAMMVAAGGAPATPIDEENALGRARKTVRMLDDIYKTTVVLITEKYVHDEDDFPAGSAAIALFDAVKKKGWHEVRLLDATGNPYDEQNVAADDFERKAVRALKEGKSYYEALEVDGDRTYLRAATPIPVVLQKCTMCHPHYQDVAQGEPIGALSYRLALE